MRARRSEQLRPLGRAVAVDELDRDMLGLDVEQARDDAFRRLAARDAYLLDVEPEHVAVELVNRYRAAKRAQLL